FIKSAGTGETIVNGGITFENLGTVEAQTGTIRFDGKSNHTDAAVTAAPGAAVRFHAGTHTVVGTLSGDPGGAVFIDGGALQADAGGGTLALGGTGFDWRGGTIDGGATLTNAGTMTLSTGSSKVLDLATTLVNTGTMTWTGGTLFIENISTVDNQGLFEAQSNNAISPFGDGPNTFNNDGGSFIKTAGTGNTTLSLTFNNLAGGIVSAESGTIDFNGTFFNAGGGLVQGNTTVDFAGAGVANEGAFGPGTSPGILTHVGNYDMSAATTALNIELGGLTPGDHDQLVVTSGSATLGGALNVSLFGGYTPNDGDTFVILTATGGVSGTFTNTNANDRIYVGDGLAFTVLYNANDVTLQADLLEADYAVTKTVDQATVGVGTDVTFTLTITNNGPDDLSEFGVDAGIEVTDLLPAGLAFVSATPSEGAYDDVTGLWSVGALANGASATLEITTTVNTTGTVTNTAALTASSIPDTNGANDSVDAAVESQAADLAVTKVVDNAAVDVGTDVTFTVTLTNNGPNDVTGAAVTDLLPAGLAFVSATPSQGAYDDVTGLWSVGALANGASATLEITTTVNTTGTVTNTAAVTASDLPDADDANDGDSADVTGSAATADLAVTKTVDNASAGVGENVVFTVTLTNNGPADATGVAVTDLLPAGLAFVSATPSQGAYDDVTGLWSVGALANGASATLEITATVTVTETVTNTAAVTASDLPDPNQDNDSDSAVVDKCANVDPGDLPFWDGTITSNGDGTGSIPLEAPLGLKGIELVDFNNLVLDDVQDGGGTSLVGADQFECTAINSDGCLTFAWTGADADAPVSVSLVIRAPAVAGSSFFLHITDCCDHTLRVDPQFSLYETSIDETPQTFALEQNYPNPFNPQTRIVFALPEASSVRLTVYDVLGREVVTLAAGRREAGRYAVTWNGRNAAGSAVPSGVYLYRIEAGSFVETRQMTLLK
ncbi:FlgD immunoglobulin-like domain containing protein, partial [Rhodocaloribacter sp.]